MIKLIKSGTVEEHGSMRRGDSLRNIIEVVNMSNSLGKGTVRYKK